VHESETWASALRHVSRRSAEVARVNEDDASRTYSPSPSGGAERADPESAVFPPAAAGPGSVFTADRAEEKKNRNNVSSSSASGEEQGGAYWHALRASRLTASAFANAMGFWSGGRNALWEEKLGLAPPFAGNDATEWGTRTEDEAAAAYARLTGADVSRVLFRVLSPDEAELWLGASPDGLIAAPAAQSGGDGGDDAPDRSSLPPGVLEIKCPWNRGRPLDATPYPRVPWYYVPQVQGLMAVFDRPYCDVFCYTVNGGSAIYRVERDPEYWALMYRALSDFWWQHVVPGKHALEKAGNTDAAAAGDGDDGTTWGDAGGGRAEAAWEKYRPPETHELTEELKRRSREMAERAAQRKYSAEDTRGA
jgi:uracil-DNA glycosylase